MVENTGQKIKRQLPIAKQEDVEFAVELADAEDIEASERAEEANYRQEDAIREKSDKKETILAYFKSEDAAEGIALKLKVLKAADVRIEPMRDDYDQGNNPSMFPLNTANFLALGGMATMGTGFVGAGAGMSGAGTGTIGAAGVGLLSLRNITLGDQSDGGEGLGGRRDVMLTAVIEQGEYDKALQVIFEGDGEV